MKKFFKIFGITLLVLIVILLVTPYFFKGKILNLAKTELNNRLDAKVSIEDVSLSLFKNFPNLYVGLHNTIVIGKDHFKNDTLANVSNIHTSVNLFAAILGEVEIKSLGLEKTTIHTKVLKSGKANWDIVKQTENTTTKEENSAESSETSSSSMKLVFKEVTVDDFALTYEDIATNTIFSIDNLHLILSGDFSAKSTNLDVKSTIEAINLQYNNIKYMKNVKLTIDAIIAANFEAKTFNVKENKIGVNNLFFTVNGNFGMINDGYNMDLTMKANRADFKSLMGMIPDTFKTEIKDLQTTGKFEITAFAKGTLKGDNYPAFGAKLNVDNASLKYPKLTESVNKIQVDAILNHPQGNLDALTFDLNRFTFEVAKNPFSATFHLKYPMSDPLLQGKAKGTVDFKTLKQAIPMEQVNITGSVIADLVMNGRYSSIEKETYEKFNVKGKAELKQFSFKSKSFPQGVVIDKSTLNLTSRNITLKSLKANVGKSDFNLKGKLSNYIPYIVKGKTLQGNFSVTSKLFDTNEFLAETETPKDTTAIQSTDTIPLSIIEVPANLNLKMVSTFKQIRYDKMDITNVKGLIVVKDAAAKLTNLSMDMLKGNMVMTGLYSTEDVTKPRIDFNLDIKQFDINTAYNSISFIKKMVPMAMNCNGKMSSEMHIKSVLDTVMQPIMETLNGSGFLHAQKIIINDNKALKDLAKLLKNTSFERITVEDLNVNYVIENGNITVKPFTTKIAGQQATIHGTKSVDGALDFSMMIKLPHDKLGKEVTKIFDKLPGMKKVKVLDVGVKITGTVDAPKVKLDLSKAIKQAKKAMLKELGRKAKKKMKNFFKDLF